MITIILMTLDVFLVLFLALTIFRFFRVIFMRATLIKKLKKVCNTKKYKLEVLRFPFSSIFYKSRKVDLIVKTPQDVYYVKLVSSFSAKKVFHFVDSTNYITYLKTYFALPMANSVSEGVHLVSYHQFPKIIKKEPICENEKYVVLFNPVPNEITYISKDGSKQIAGNGAMLEEFYIYNGKGFCSLLDRL